MMSENTIPKTVADVPTETTSITDRRQVLYSSCGLSQTHQTQPGDDIVQSSVSAFILGLICAEVDSMESLAAPSPHTSSVPCLITRSRPQMDYWSQAYYWTESWQEGEKETLAELRAGEGSIFDNAQDAIDWLSTD